MMKSIFLFLFAAALFFTSCHEKEFVPPLSGKFQPQVDQLPQYILYKKWFVTQTTLTRTIPGQAGSIKILNFDHTDYLLLFEDETGIQQTTNANNIKTVRLISYSFALTQEGDFDWIQVRSNNFLINWVIDDITPTTLNLSRTVYDKFGVAVGTNQVDYTNQ